VTIVPWIASPRSLVNVAVPRLADGTEHGVEGPGDVGVAVVGGMLVEQRGGGRGVT
jgi:hypothetical protein